jgi:glutamyl-Q tRNA(Asp) synthetase
MPPTTRFAPSPTGHLHLGHVFAALTAWRRARAAGGRFLVRLEDIDPARCRPEFAHAILADLRWLGLLWDDDVRVQSHHLAAYRAALDRLAADRLLYPCFCTRADIVREVAAAAAAPHGPDGKLYPGTCRQLSDAERAARIAAGIPYALRLDMARALARIPQTLRFHEDGEGDIRCDPAQFGDVVLGRKDVPASYHLCVTHDDAAQGVTLVTRGSDLKPATHLHRLLQVLLGWPAPHYAHHRLLTDSEGRRLSKRDRAVSISELRARGATPAAILAAL